VDVENEHETSAALLFDFVGRVMVNIQCRCAMTPLTPPVRSERAPLGVRSHSLLAAFAVLFSLLLLCDGNASGRPLGFELYLVADLHVLEHLWIFHFENHGYAVFIHVEVLDGIVFERDLSGRFIDFLNFAIDGGRL
jgi:hypothetical protein